MTHSIKKPAQKSDRFTIRAVTIGLFIFAASQVLAPAIFRVIA